MSKIAGAMGRRRLPPEEDPPEVADATAAFASAINAAVGPDLSMEPAPELGPGARPSAGMMAITEATARRQAELRALRLRVAVRMVDGANGRNRLPPYRPVGKRAAAARVRASRRSANGGGVSRSEQGAAGAEPEGEGTAGDSDSELLAQLAALAVPAADFTAVPDQQNREGVAAGYVWAQPASAAQWFRQQGMLAVRGAASAGLCSELCRHIDRCLEEAAFDEQQQQQQGAGGGGSARGNCRHAFGKIYADGAG